MSNPSESSSSPEPKRAVSGSITVKEEASEPPKSPTQPPKEEKPARSVLPPTGLEDGGESIPLSKLPKKRGGLPKRDRATLRKGKWTVRRHL